MKQGTYPLLIIAAIAGAILPEIYTYFSALTIHPGSFDGKMVCYSDSSELVGREGNSTVELVSPSGREVSFCYTLNDSFSYYYSGILLQFDSGIIKDFSRYSDVTLDLEVGNAKGMMFFFLSNEFPDGEIQKINESRHIQYQLISKGPKRHSYKIKLDNFYTPIWWYHLSGKKPETVDSIPLKQEASDRV